MGHSIRHIIHMGLYSILHYFSDTYQTSHSLEKFTKVRQIRSIIIKVFNLRHVYVYNFKTMSYTEWKFIQNKSNSLNSGYSNW